MPQMSAFASRKARTARQGRERLLDARATEGATDGPSDRLDAAFSLPTPLGTKRGTPLPAGASLKRPRTQTNGNPRPMQKNREVSSPGSSPATNVESDADGDSDAANATSKQVDYELSRLVPPALVEELGRGATHYVLRPGEKLTLIGQYKMWIKSGFVSILGALFHPGPASYMVFAPSTHSLPAIKHVNPPPGYTDPNAEVIIESAYTGLRGLGRLNRSFRGLWNYQDGTSRSFAYLQWASDDTNGRNLRPFRQSTAWATVADSIARRAHQAPVIFICGPLNCGKSSFARILINRMMTHPKTDFARKNGIEFLDLDPGQPEYSPPGEITLTKVQELNLGPPYSHPMSHKEPPNQLIRAHHIGDTTPANDVQHYLDCVADLSTKHDSGLPMIINGCGWTRDMGLEVMEKVARTFDCTDIVMLSNSGMAELSDLDQMVGRIAQPSTAVHRLYAESHKGHPARELRQMQAMSYFHFDDPIHYTPSWDCQPLFNSPGQSLRWGGESPDICGVIVYDNRIDPSHLKTILNGNICALVAVEDRSLLLEDLREQGAHVPYLFHGRGGACDPFDPRKSRSLGQVLIQRIDELSQILHVVTPLPLDDIVAECRNAGHALVLVQSRLDAPGWAYSETRHEAESKEKDLAAWITFRENQIRTAGGTVSSDGVRGPNGEDWSSEEVLDQGVEGEDEFGVEQSELESPWIEQEQRRAAETTSVTDAAKVGGKKWKVRRNLIVGGGSQGA